MGDEVVEGPVYEEPRRVPTGTRVQINIPVKTSLALNGGMFVYSGYFLYHTLKGLYKVHKEVPS